MERSGGFQPRSTAPVNVGDELEVTIESVGAKGDGVAKKDGFVLFVPGVQKGDNVRIRVTRVLRKVGFAEVVGQSDGSSDDAQPEEQESEEEETPQENASESTEEAAPVEDSEDFGEDDKQ